MTQQRCGFNVATVRHEEINGQIVSKMISTEDGFNEYLQKLQSASSFWLIPLYAGAAQFLITHNVVIGPSGVARPGSFVQCRCLFGSASEIHPTFFGLSSLIIAGSFVFIKTISSVFNLGDPKCCELFSSRSAPALTLRWRRKSSYRGLTAPLSPPQ